MTCPVCESSEVYTTPELGTSCAACGHVLQPPGSPVVGWLDFEPEPEGTGDGSGDPEKHILTIVLDPGGDNEEIAVVVHRTVGDKYPIDGEIANRKRKRAQLIVDALNNFGPQHLEGML